MFRDSAGVAGRFCIHVTSDVEIIPIAILTQIGFGAQCHGTKHVIG